MRMYILYSCNGRPTTPEKCTTRWPDSVQCTIHLSLEFDGKTYNLMNMDGDEAVINQWLSENTGKVISRTREEFATLIATRFPVGTQRTITEDGVTRTYTLASFDVDTGPVFTVTEG